MDKLQFYRLEDRAVDHPQLVPANITFASLHQQVKEINSRNDGFTIYYRWKPLQTNRYGSLTLKQIVEEDHQPAPVFHVYDHVGEGNECRHRIKYGEAVALHQRVDQDAKDYWIGSNGHVLFDNRKTAILASSVKHASCQEKYAPHHHNIVRNFNSAIIEENQTKEPNEQGLIRRLLKKLGIIHRKPTPQNLMKTINAIKDIDSQQKLREHIDREYSDYDANFATYLEAVYIRFAILNAYRLHYIEYKSMDEGIIQSVIPKGAKVAIIGDYGTGLPDSIALLKDLIIDKQVDIILHLGDVYYAGTPHQYEQHVTRPLQELRELAKKNISPNKDVLFYSIPGNHDYYSWGLPFLSFVFNINEGKLQKQRASYFCLRSEQNRWQFIGLDTAYHDSNPANQINGLSLGPHLRHREVEWFEDKMQNFSGSTVLLTHHQLFSIHDRICGSMSKYKQFSCLNPLLSAQLFKYLPHFSGWFWGHEHSFMLFADDVMGVRKCRLLGNSSFHVFEKQAPYTRKPCFPYIPLIVEDDKYSQKYLPVEPGSEKQNFYNLCYALIDFSKEKKIYSAGIFASSLPIQYYCCPCYPPEEAPIPHFKPYILYQELLNPRIDNVVAMNQNKQFYEEDQPILKTNNFQDVLVGEPIQIKTEIGLFVDENDILNLEGCKLKVVLVESSWTEGELDPSLKDRIIDDSIISFTLFNSACTADSVLFGHKFKIHKKRVLKDSFVHVRTGDAFTLQDMSTGEYLGCQIQSRAFLKSFQCQKEDHPCLFMFISDSKVKKGTINDL